MKLRDISSCLSLSLSILQLIQVVICRRDDALLGVHNFREVVLGDVIHVEATVEFLADGVLDHVLATRLLAFLLPDFLQFLFEFLSFELRTQLDFFFLLLKAFVWVELLFQV